MISRFADEQHIFAFDQAYVDNRNRSTLSLSYKGSSGRVMTSVRPYKDRLPPFFSNLLPEGQLRDYLAARAGVKPDQDFFLLAALGADLPGAISVTHMNDEADEIREEEKYARARRSILKFSLAGLQLKFSAVLEANGVLMIPADGMGGTWIVKLPSARFEGVTENEFAMMELARRIGIPVPGLKLVSVSEIESLPKDLGKTQGRALAVERFDRKPDGGRIHMEDFAQLFGIRADKKYEKRSYAHIAEVLAAESGAESVNDFARRLVFSLLIGNTDMHLKNWSLLYKDGRKASLAPAYDFISTVPYVPDDKLALAFGGGRNIDSITQDQIRQFAETARLAVNPLWQIVLETTEKTVAAWKTLEAREEIPAVVRKAIDKQINRVAISIK